MKKIALASLFVLSMSLVVPQVAPKRPEARNYSWRILENAQVAFDSARYAEAMNLANKAKENRRAEIEWEVYVLERAFSPLAVRRAGDLFPDVLKVLRERDENDAVSLINKYLRLYGEEFFGGSTAALLDWVKKKNVYPEADLLIGKIYQLEGEYATAYSFYEKARLESDYLDIPDTQYDILYAMSNLINSMGADDWSLWIKTNYARLNLSKNAKQKEAYEQQLLLILDSDEYFKDNTLHNAFMRILSADRPEDVDRFFMLFRANTVNTLEALYELGNIYKEQNKNKDALVCSALGSIEAFTHIYEAICERDTSYEYTTYADFLKKCSQYEDILDWGEENHVWETMFLMADRVNDSGKSRIAAQFFSVMARAMPDEYWRATALNRLN